MVLFRPFRSFVGWGRFLNGCLHALAIFKHRQLQLAAEGQVGIEVHIGVDFLAFGLFCPTGLSFGLVFLFFVELVF